MSVRFFIPRQFHTPESATPIMVFENFMWDQGSSVGAVHVVAAGAMRLQPGSFVLKKNECSS
jgi:hypothetical protein